MRKMYLENGWIHIEIERVIVYEMIRGKGVLNGYVTLGRGHTK